MTANRLESRKALAQLLQVELVDVGPPDQLAAAVYPYQKGNFGSLSPVVTVTSGGSQRQNRTAAGSQAGFYLNVHIFVLYALEDGSWTEQDAEDRLDEIEHQIAIILTANRAHGPWQAISMEGRSLADSIEIGGSEYRREIIPVRLEVY